MVDALANHLQVFGRVTVKYLPDAPIRPARAPVGTREGACVPRLQLHSYGDGRDAVDAMNAELKQHQIEMRRNRRAWDRKPRLREIYAGYYRRIVALIDPRISGRILEIGSGMGHLKTHLPQTIASDLFPNPWLDVVCDGYELPFRDGTISHLVLFDVFHHLQAPGVLLNEARRILTPAGRLILFEPYISWVSHPIYGLGHHEPIAWRKSIDLSGTRARPRTYYAAQGNATRLFFEPVPRGWLSGWSLFHREAWADFSYLLSGGFSKPCLYPARLSPALRWLDAGLSRWPGLFGARCLVGLGRDPDGSAQLGALSTSQTPGLSNTMK